MITVLDKLGSLQREPDSTHVVVHQSSYRGQPLITPVFFADEGSALIYAHRMATVPGKILSGTVEQYDRILSASIG